MRQGLIRGAGLLLALALHAAVLAPYWLAPQTLQGGSGGPVSSGRALNLSLTEARTTPEKAPEQPKHEPKPKPEPEPAPKPEPDPEAVKTEQKPESEKEKEKEKSEEQTEPEPEEEAAKNPKETQEPKPAQQPAGDGREAGPGAHDEGERDNAWNRYLGKIQRAIEQRKTYPRRARLRRQEGVVRINFSVDPKGRVSAVNLEDSSGSRILDRHVQSLLRESSLPTPPEGLDVSNREITLPVQFRLR
jgi:protein TonB